MAEIAPPVRRSPLGHRTPVACEGGVARMAERPFLGKLILRAVPEEAVERLRVALGLGLPFDPLTSSTAGSASFLWMGPDEWMLVTDPAEVLGREGEARQALAGTRHQLVDVTDYYTVIELAGPRARAMLMKLTTVDLHPRAFRAGMVIGCLLGRSNAVLWQTADDAAEAGPAFQIFIRWSMADYLWCLIADAGREWFMPEQAPLKGETLSIAE